MNSKGFLLAALVVATLGSGCLGPSADGQDGITIEPPGAYTGDPVPGAGFATMDGSWHVRTSLSGLSVWAAMVDTLPVDGFWQARWTPDSSGGYIVLSGVTAVSVSADHQAWSSPAVSWARPSEAATHEGIVWTSSIGDGPWLVLFAAQAFEASGTLELTIQWRDGEAREWRPFVDDRVVSSVVERFKLRSGTPLLHELPMDEHDAVHVVVPCQRSEKAAEALAIELGSRQPNRFDVEGENQARQWASYLGLWTYEDDVAPLRLAYEGPNEPTVAVIRSATELSDLVEQELGYRIGLKALGTKCAR